MNSDLSAAEQFDDLPKLSEGWRWVRLGELVDSDRGICYGIVQPGKHADDGVPLVNTGDIYDGYVNKKISFRVITSLHEQFKRSTLRGGEILVTLVGANFGRVAIAPASYRGYNCSRAVGVVPINIDLSVDAEYIMFSLRSPVARRFMDNWANTTAQPTFNLKDVARLPIAIPSASEAKRISELLGAIDGRIDILRETNATLEAIAQTLFKSWFVDFDPVRAKAEGRQPEGMDPATAALFPDTFEDSEFGPIPRGWRVGGIGEIAEVIDCLHSKKPELIENGLPFLQLSNIRDDGLLDTSEVACISEADYTKWTSRLEASEGDCVITNVGRVGAVAQIPAGYKAAMGRNMTGIRLKTGYPYPTYLVELLLSAWMRAEIQTRTDVGTILDALNVRSIPMLRCFIAPKSVFDEFEDLCRPIRAAMEANLERAISLARLRDALLPRLISGKLRLPEAQSQLEAALA